MIVRTIAFLSTPYLALAASEHHGWTRFFIAVLFVIVFGTILVRALRTEPTRRTHHGSNSHS